MAINDGNRSQGGTNQMSDAFGRAGFASGSQQSTAQATQQATGTTGSTQPVGGAAPSHTTLNAGSGRNPQMDSPSNAGAPFSWRGGPPMAVMMNRSPASEVLNKLHKALEQYYKEHASDLFEFRLIPLDLNQLPELSVSAIVLAALFKQAPEIGVAFHTFILAGSIEPPQSRFENIGGRNVEIVRVVGEAFDEPMLKLVTEKVRQQYPQANLLNTEAEVVPADFNTEDSKAMWKLAANGAWAVGQELQVHMAGFSDVSIVNAQNDSNLVIRTNFHGEPLRDATDMPVRSDVTIDFFATAPNQNQPGGNDRQTPLSRLAGFIDLVWDAPAQAPGFGGMGGGWGQNNQPNYQRYVARYVNTLLDSEKSLTVAMQLMSLIPALALREGNAWVQAFKPTPVSSPSDIDLRDIGAIGYEVNFENNPNGQGDKIDTKSANFRDEHLFKLIQSAFRPGLILSMDVPECGPQTWYSSVFAAAAEGNPRAEAAILQAADRLTGGHFSRYFPAGARVVVDEANRIHLGYYTTTRGERRDIRDWDYLAILNMEGGRSPSVVKEFSDTYLRREYPPALRLSERLRILRAVEPSVTVTGYARRVTLTSEFSNALASGCRDAGLTVRAASTFQDLGQYERASGAYLNSHILGSDPVGVFNRGGFGAFNGGGAGPSLRTRW